MCVIHPDGSSGEIRISGGAADAAPLIRPLTTAATTSTWATKDMTPPIVADDNRNAQVAATSELARVD